MVGRPKIQARAYAPHKIKEELTVNQRLFAEEIIADPFMSATQAAIRAGYSEKTAQVKASQLLKHPVIARMVGSAINERLRRTQISQDEVLQFLINVMYLDPLAILNNVDGAVKLKDLNDIPPELRILITKIKTKTRTIYEGDNAGSETTVELEWVSKELAVQLLMKHLGMVQPDQTNVNFNVNAGLVTQIREAIANKGKVIDGSVIKKMVDE